MGTVNRMSYLLDKIERRLGVRFILEKNCDLNKDAWADVIMSDTMDTFSRFFPYKYTIYLNSDTCVYKNGYYIINENLLDPLDITGVGDIDWSNAYATNQYNSLVGGYYDQFANPLSVYDVGLVKVAADVNSLFNNGIFIRFEEPNKLRVEGTMKRDILQGFKNLPLTIFIKHRNLTTIAPTKMEIFEKLATSDVATFLLGELKYFDGYETNYGNIDLKLEDLREWSLKRDSIIEELEAGYVNPANKSQSIMMTI